MLLAIDTAGGNILATLLKSIGRRGSVATCGLVASANLHTTVYPFILRGVNLLGIDSAETHREDKIKIWELLSDTYDVSDIFSKLVHDMELESVIEYAENMLKGQAKGRVVIGIEK